MDNLEAIHPKAPATETWSPDSAENIKKYSKFAIKWYIF